MGASADAAAVDSEVGREISILSGAKRTILSAGAAGNNVTTGSPVDPSCPRGSAEMRKMILRSGVLGVATLAVLGVAAAPSYAAGQPYCPGPPLGTFWGTTVNADGVHTDTYISWNFPSAGINFRTRSC
jgi:hypothetical protein